jgi:hypothetical protein
MAITKISDLKSKIGVGARSNLFKVTISTGSTSGGFNGQSDNFSYLCKGAQLPGSTLGLIEVPFQAGRRYKLAGDRTFVDWTTTIINDSNQNIRRAIENLQVGYGATNFEGAVSKTVDGAESTDFSTLVVTQYDLSGRETYVYTLENCWPSDISTIDLSYDSTDVLEEFTVTWTYDYFTYTHKRSSTPSSSTSTV